MAMDAPSSDGIEVLSYTKAGPPDLGSNARASTSSAAAVGRTDASRRDDEMQFQPRRASPLKQRQLLNSPTPDMDETQRDSDDDEDVVVVSDVKRAQDRSDSEELPDLNQLRNALRIQDHNRRSTSTASLDKGKGKAVSRSVPLPSFARPDSRASSSTSILPVSGQASKTTTTKKRTAVDHEERAAKKAREEAEKAAKKQLKAVNTLKRDRTMTVRELTAHLSGKAFDDAGPEDDQPPAPPGRKGAKKKAVSPWLAISRLFRERMLDEDNLGCDVQIPDRPRRDLMSEGAMRWTRVCDRQWNDELKRFVPLPHGKQLVVEEDVRLIFMTATELSKLVADDKLVRHIKDIQSRVQLHVTLTIMLYGIRAIERAIKNALNAQVRNSIRQQLDEDAVPTSNSTKAKEVGIGDRQPSKEQLELALMRAQVATRCLIVRVEKEEEAVDWLEQITRDVSFKPYQRQKQSHAILLGSVDGVSVGHDSDETYRKMLACVKGVTDSVAKNIAYEYPTLRKLYEQYAMCESDKERAEMLVGIAKGTNVNGQTTHRSIGPVVSEAVFKTFMSLDGDAFV